MAAIKTFFLKYKPAIIVTLVSILLFAGTIIYYRALVSSLRRQLFDNRIEHVMEMDRMIGDLLREQHGKIDSLLIIEQRRYDSLVLRYRQTKSDYEKIRTDYSDIVIDRPEF